MRNFFQKILILFTGNNYPEATQNEFYQWLVDEDHASQKEDALRELWNKAQRQKNVKGMQKSYEQPEKTGRYSNRTQREKNSPNTYMAIRSRYLIPPACLFGLSIDCRHKSGNRLVTAIYSDSRNEKFDAARRNKSATQLEKYTFISAGVYRR